MALKGRRSIEASEISFRMDEVASAGGVVCYGATSGTGDLMDQAATVATYRASASGGAALGVLLSEMVSIDVTQGQQVNYNKDQVARPGPVAIMRRGYVNTNMLEDTGDTITAGQVAYVGYSGLLHNDTAASGRSLAVGRFEGAINSEGYVRVYINLT